MLLGAAKQWRMLAKHAAKAEGAAETPALLGDT